MIIEAGDLCVTLDTGTNAPGAKLQRKEPDGWHDYQSHGKRIHEPVDINTLPPGNYRLQNLD